MTISSSIDDATAPAPAPAPIPLSRICFLCNATESDTFLNLYEALTFHSNTPVFDFVWKFLDDKPSVRDDTVDAANSSWNSICVGCFTKINEYDLACETAARLEEELRWELSQTEATYATAQQNVAHSSSQVQPAQTEFVEEIQIVNIEYETVELGSSHPVAEAVEEQQNGDPIDDSTIELSDDEEGNGDASATVAFVNIDENPTIVLSDDDL